MVVCPDQIAEPPTAISVVTANAEAVESTRASEPVPTASITRQGSTTRRAPNRSISVPPSGDRARVTAPNQPITRPARVSVSPRTSVR